MTRTALCLLLSFLALAGACFSGGESKLSKGLTVAVKEKKITQEKVETILAEYENIRDDDKKKAQEYVTQVLSAIQMGGDSSHIDAVRRQILKTKPAKRKI